MHRRGVDTGKGESRSFKYRVAGFCGQIKASIIEQNVEVILREVT
jgi:hypothetical protein